MRTAQCSAEVVSAGQFIDLNTVNCSQHHPGFALCAGHLLHDRIIQDLFQSQTPLYRLFSLHCTMSHRTVTQGVLCYMLLSGSPPFNGKTVEAVYEATLTQDPSFPDRKFR